MARKTYTRGFREQFVHAWFRARDEATFIEHCERFGVSRDSGYEWLRRFDAGGAHALQAKPSAPHSVPHATDAEMVRLIVDARHAHPTWGPRKLRAWLEDTHPWELELPAPSTMGDILKRAGLVASKKRRRLHGYHPTAFINVEAPNDVWTTDFKGHFRLRNGRYCYPLTLCDGFSRYLLRCDAYHSSSIECRRSFEMAFVEYGLPRAIRSDNGSPFAASQSLAALSQLSIWWLRLGIVPERITPGSPWENGRHERMHRTLKAEATDPPQANNRQQQHVFDSFKREFNDERPHEALGFKTPSKLFAPSLRHYPQKLPEIDYPTGYHLRRVSEVGVISVAGRRTFLTTVLAGEVVALKQEDDDKWRVFFGSLALCVLDTSASEISVEDVAR